VRAAVALFSLLVVVSFVAPGPVGADLIVEADPIFGRVVRDDQTNLTWLAIESSSGLSFDEALSEIRPGGLFDGWRHATTAEVCGLFANAAAFDCPTPAGLRISFTTKAQAPIRFCQATTTLVMH
jgi:hypothetical protein